jgi:hypothetical protein
MFHPKVASVNINPHAFSVQTMPNSLQTPFFFGGSQVPTDLCLPHGSFSGSGMIHSHHLHEHGKLFQKGTASRTHMGEQDFTTKKGSLVFHEHGHRIKRGRRPYSEK